MARDRAPAADIEIVATAAADELRFDAQPEVWVTFRGTGKRDSRHVTRRENIDTPVHPGTTYRRVRVTTRISSRLLDTDEEARATRLARRRAGS